MKIKNLGILLVGLILLVSAIFSFALTRAVQQFDETSKSTKRSYQRVALPLQQMDANTKNLRFHLYAAFMHDERQSVAHYHTHPLQAHTDAIRSAINSNRALWEQLSDNMKIAELGVDLEPLKRIYDAYYTKGIEPGITAAEGKDWDSIVKTVTGSLSEYGAFESAMKAQLKAIADGEDAAAQQAISSQRSLLAGVAIVAAVVMLGSAWVVWNTVNGVKRRLTAVIVATEAMSNGDLSAIAVDSGNDEAAEALRAVGAMQAKLSAVIAAVRGSAESVATASAEIAQGNQDLSQRTEEQSSMLQLTSTNMDQLSSTVRNNASSAVQANRLAQDSTAVAQLGGEVVGNVVSTMQAISDSSRRIGDIIGVIDSIAFQTNILALNAAVEAARAGEQGRGFAVVASEVRSLAQRSADAAKEIKSLIGHSVSQVEQGTHLVGQAGTTMNDIVDSIQRVQQIIAEINESSAAQSVGITQIGDAIGQMDQVTQQNSALVEQSAAAAESLKYQAQNLVEAVALFRVAK
jgi:methyl-accepting chemotaxis protein